MSFQQHLCKYLPAFFVGLRVQPSSRPTVMHPALPMRGVSDLCRAPSAPGAPVERAGALREAEGARLGAPASCYFLNVLTRSLPELVVPHAPPPPLRLLPTRNTLWGAPLLPASMRTVLLNISNDSKNRPGDPSTTVLDKMSQVLIALWTLNIRAGWDPGPHGPGGTRGPPDTPAQPLEPLT